MSGKLNGKLGALLGSGARPFLLGAIALLALLPLLNLVVPPNSAFFLPDFTINIIGKWLCYAILALSIDLIWGYVGILSLGHGAFFALGGYAMGMYLMRAIGDRGVYKNPVLPDFMVFLNWKELPWYWWGMDNFAFAMLMVIAVPGLLAFVFGWLAFRSRITGVYLSIITQAMTFAFLLAFFRNDMGFGGNNGMTDFKDILGIPLNNSLTRAGLYWASLIVLILTYLLCRFIIRSKLGRVLTAVRDAESRVRFLGYSVTRYKLFAFVLSAMIAGVAGALYTPQAGIINPSEFSPANSIEAVIWVAVGGRGSLIGAVIGAFMVNGVKSWLTSNVAELWPFILGGLFVMVTLFLPRGLVGLFSGKGGGPRIGKPSFANLLNVFGTKPPMAPAKEPQS